MMLFIIHYVQLTEMKRIHIKENMTKYYKAYYEAFELMLNHSHLKEIIITLMQRNPEINEMIQFDQQYTFQ